MKVPETIPIVNIVNLFREQHLAKIRRACVFHHFVPFEIWLLIRDYCRELGVILPGGDYPSILGVILPLYHELYYLAYWGLL